ncbi:T9SS type A sorting domain-containing protein [candidate division KSB1 bacterium]|nr:T9SS type A sorting domain-containing protein [candidate division KSB1 bacterium]NIS23528.1 T9SS type A sorting domain-containing protein [candidate division KSB1 bacterium]NIT70458.1 T9SS type A sorting domain-containing protein [candidate division KSB1 bacterium]NIU24155.1 T9SS type A sorting domain-containing protein [candidate division KSB1 bacterium]NIU93409.1 T9SS type A sorting domain-containing protein [candidate division KSB1 bacterium]
MPEWTQWKETAHAVAYDSVSAFVQQTARCLECHTTGWDTTVTNQGADEFVEVTEPYEGNFNVTITDSAGFLAKTNVQCESCHGPSSDHPTNPSGIKPPTVIPAEQCGQCHQGQHTPYLENWLESKHAISNTNDNAFLQNLFRNDPECSGCHTFQGFLEFVGETPEDTTNIVPDVQNPPGDESLPLVCAACHDPHNALHEGQLRLQPVDLCAKCHNPEDAEPPDNPHHSTDSMFEGTGAFEFADVEYTRESTHQLLPRIQEVKCIACHVFMTEFDDGGTPEDPTDDVLANTGHTFFPRIEACQQSGCHINGLEIPADSDPELSEFDHRGRRTFTKNLIDSLEAIVTNIEQNVLPTASPQDSMDYQIGLFNLRFAKNEGSVGVHNPEYAQDILESTIAFLDTAIVTSVEPIADPVLELPETFALHQNYPNPFNPSTTIRFDVPESGHVRLVIFNSLGQVVETLVDEQLKPNTYEVEFDASQYSSGLYFYKLVSDNFTTTRKMLLLK